MSVLDSIPCFTKIDFAKIRKARRIKVKPSISQRRAMAEYLVRSGFTIKESCKSVKLSLNGYYSKVKKMPQ